MDQIDMLISYTRQAFDQGEKIRLLNSLKELVLYRDPALLPYAVPRLPELYLLNGYPELKVHIIQFLDDVFRRETLYLPHLLDCLSQLAPEQDDEVVKHVFIANNNIYKRAIKIIANNVGPLPGNMTMLDLWHGLERLKYQLLDHLHTPSEVIRAHAVKLHVNLILIYSEPERRQRGSSRRSMMRDQLSLADIPASHPILRPADLRVEGEELLKQYCQMIHTGGTGAGGEFTHLVFASAINGLCLLATQRVQWMPQFLPLFSQLMQNMATYSHINPLRQKNMWMSVKGNLLKFLRTGVANSEVRDGLVNILVTAGCAEQAQKAVDFAAAVTGMHERIVIDDRGRGRHRQDGSAIGYPPTMNTLDVEKIPLADTELVVDLIFANMQNIPPPPPDHANSRQRARPIEQILETLGIEKRDPRRRPGQQTASTGTMLPLLQPEIAAQLSQTIRSILASPAVEPTPATAVPEAQKDIPASGAAPIEQGQGNLKSDDGAVGASGAGGQRADAQAQVRAQQQKIAEELEKNAPKLVNLTPDNNVVVTLPPKVEPEWCKKIAEFSFQRITKAERGLLLEGQGTLRAAVLSRMACNSWLAPLSALESKGRSEGIASKQANNNKEESGANANANFYSSTKVSPLTDKLITHIVADAHSRLHLAASLLFQEFANRSVARVIEGSEGKDAAVGASAHSENPLDSRNRYNRVVHRFLRKLKDTLDPSTAADKKLFRDILKMLPVVTPQTLTVIEEYVEDPAGTNLGILALRDLVIERPPCKLVSQRLLLQFATHKDPDIREKAIRCIANQLLKDKATFSVVVRYSIKLVDSLVDAEHRPPPTPAVQTDVEDEGNTADGQESAEFDPLERIVAQLKAGTTEKEFNTDDPMEEDENNESSNVKFGVVAKHLNNEDIKACTYLASSLGEDVYDDGLPSTAEEVSQRLDLYLAMCTRESSLLHRLFKIFAHSSETVKEACIEQIERLIKTLDKLKGPMEVLNIIGDFQEDTRPLVLRTIEILAPLGKQPDAELIARVKSFKDDDESNLVLLVPLLHWYTKEEVLEAVPILFKLPEDDLKKAILRITDPAGPLRPAEFLLMIHQLDPKIVPLKNVLLVRKYCFEFPEVFSRHSVETTLQDALQLETIPIMIVSTLMLALDVFPKLKSFAIHFLSQLVEKEVWKITELWTGFRNCLLLREVIANEELHAALKHHCEAIIENPARHGEVYPELLELVGLPPLVSGEPSGSNEGEEDPTQDDDQMMGEAQNAIDNYDEQHDDFEQ